MFINGRCSVHDDDRSGRPTSSRETRIVDAVRDVVYADQRLTLDEILLRLPMELGRTSLHKIIKEDLKLSKVCSRWVPRILTEQHQRQRVESAQKFLELYENEGDNLFSRIVTGDETWVHHVTPETKRQSMVWKKKGEPAPKKAKTTLSAGKVMATVFWDNQGILLIDYLERGTTINAQRYCDVL